MGEYEEDILDIPDIYDPEFEGENDIFEEDCGVMIECYSEYDEDPVEM